jgi:hypothetical protein
MRAGLFNADPTIASSIPLPVIRVHMRNALSRLFANKVGVHDPDFPLLFPQCF